MTAKEKAEDLLLKFSILNEGQNEIVKKLVIIYCKEMQNLLPDINLIPPVKRLPDINYRQYWFSVEAYID